MAAEELWVKVASSMRFFSNADGTEKATALAIQSFGLRIKDCIYAILPTDRTAATTKIGARHDEGPEAAPGYFTTHSTPVTVANIPSLGKLIRGQTNGANGALLPYFAPTILVLSSGGGQESVVADVWVGGKPY